LQQTFVGNLLIYRCPQFSGASQAPISDADLTAVINWLLYELNSETLPADFEDYTEAEVSRARQDILADPLKYRAEH